MVFVIEGLTTNEATLPTFTCTCSTSSNHENITHEMYVSILLNHKYFVPRNYLLYGSYNNCIDLVVYKEGFDVSKLEVQYSAKSIIICSRAYLTLLLPAVHWSTVLQLPLYLGKKNEITQKVTCNTRWNEGVNVSGFRWLSMHALWTWIQYACMHAT